MNISKGDRKITTERRLKDYNGYQVWKVTFDEGTVREETVYMATTDNDDCVRCYISLAELKKDLS